MDNTTKFQDKFDLYQILVEAGVSAEDIKYIITAVQQHEELKLAQFYLRQIGESETFE